MPSLVAQSGPISGRRVGIVRELVVGRVDGDLVIDDAKLSRKHAIFRVVGGELEVEDLGSTNGTFVDDQRIDGPTRLASGAHVRLGTTLLMAEVEPAADLTEVSGGHSEGPGAEATVVGGRAESLTAATPAEPMARPAERAPTPAAAPAGPVGAFSPPSMRRGGLATRSWVPVVLSYGSAIGTAAALIVYFAAR